MRKQIYEALVAQGLFPEYAQELVDAIYLNLYLEDESTTVEGEIITARLKYIIRALTKIVKEKK